ncbi:MAG: hypothetical protein FJ319_08125, partial [SAR202 cluster bacterium]|nr:hypothetical protein [SAR202 cluster bacterium]
MAQSRSGGTAASARQAAPAYRIIYNWDGAPHQYNEYPPTLEKFLEKVYAPLKDTETDALFWCLGTHESSWPSKTMQFVGDSVNRRYDSVLEMRDTENIRSLFEQGIDPYAPLVKRGRELGMAVYPSIRMNDQHFWTITDLEKMQKTVTGSLTQFRKDHPEWLLGKAAPNWATTSWNMPIPEVREHRLQHVKEACMLADWDGVELDWQRHAFHLPNNDEYRLRYAITDLQRAIRRMTDEIAKKRGRPFYVAIRVAASLEACRRIGYDIETWAK